jgi:hypothetical protein
MINFLDIKHRPDMRTTLLIGTNEIGFLPVDGRLRKAALNEN